uniref:Carnitine O-acetyltransferase b n=2 Tax=Eptatretus burgeri TaxID=7764 RepID=A0A8C4QAV3_EPTBU
MFSLLRHPWIRCKWQSTCCCQTTLQPGLPSVGIIACFLSPGPLAGPEPITRRDRTALPRLPVPPQKQTLERYLASLQPLVSEEELKYTRKLLQDFARPGGLGEILQQRLEMKAQKSDNWLSNWLMDMYLANQTPLVVHSSPGVVLPKQDFKDTQGQLQFAAKLIAGVLDFKILLDTGNLKQSYKNEKPLCMDQYYKIFSSCRVPGPRRDTIVDYSVMNPPPRHITVAHNYTFFQLCVYHSSGKPLTVGQIYSQLEKIWSSSIKTTKEPIGILTTEYRHRWGAGHKILIKDKLNKESARIIQQGMFGVCLDAPSTRPPAELAMSHAAAQILHGGDSRANAGNRWFDKTLQFIVGEDGTCGLVYERAQAEGYPIMRIADHTFNFCNAMGDVEPCNTPLPQPKKLYFNINSEVKRLIDGARTHHDTQVADLDIHCFDYNKFGKDFAKQKGLSPDAFIQMAIQLAYYRRHGEVCPSSEEVTTRFFHLGRTDTISVTTLQSLAFVHGFDRDDISVQVKQQLMREAVDKHRTGTEWALSGQAVDRHLMGLKLQAIEDQYNIPELFMDTSYAFATHYILSTNQVPGQTDAVMCYGPAIPDGYGICYNPQSAKINFSVTALNSCILTNASMLARAIKDALSDMHCLLEQ